MVLIDPQFTIPETVFVLMIEHRYGFDHYANLTHEGATQVLSDYVAEWWDERDDLGEMPADAWKAINEYFYDHPDEWYILDEVELGG